MKNGESTITGTISTTRKGSGFVDIPLQEGQKRSEKESVYIEPESLNTALNGDTVEVSVEERKFKGVVEKVGKVLQVITRAKTTFVGAVDIRNGAVFVIPDDKRMYTPLTVPNPTMKLEQHDKIFVKFESWTDPKSYPVATLLKVLGKKGDNNVEMESIVLDKGFEVGFPAAVEKEADAIPQTISAEELVKRRDMRDTPTFTIDPFDAKDFDDAVSFKKLPPDPSSSQPSNLYEIGVHIADVSHYVREGTALDAEAVKRGCSIYLVDRTIPMLPEVLSNEVCSLNPHEDKLSFSAIFVLDEKAHI
ncbi:MAG: RNB domain-containing ribonuclease, partial [Patescibacteria group bacterium]